MLARSRSHGIRHVCSREENAKERRLFNWNASLKAFSTCARLVCLLVLVLSSQVEEKNNRIQEILVDLGSDETFFRPKWLDVEQPEEVFNVSEEGLHRRETKGDSRLPLDTNTQDIVCMGGEKLAGF